MSSERQPPDDRELEDFLAGRHPAGRAYREVSAQETAPRELDEAILRMAREQAVPQKPDTVVPLRRRPRWLQPLALAATLALSLGVLLNIWRDPSLRDQVAPVEEVATEATAPPPPPSPPPAAAPAPARPAPVVEDSLRVDRGLRFESQREAQPQAKREVPAAAAETRRAQPFPQERARQDAEPERDDALSDKASPSAVGPRAGSALAPASPSPPPPAPAPAPAASAPSGGGAPAPAQAAPEHEKEKKAFAPVDADRAAQPQQMHEALAAEGQAQRARDARESPEALIERAQEAIARGDREEARRVVDELRRLYPDTPLPEDLRELAR